MKLVEAEALADDFLKYIADSVERYEVCGSIRRRKPEVNDIDIVVLSRERADWLGYDVPILHKFVKELIKQGIVSPRLRSDGKTAVGEKLAELEFNSAAIDIYYATPDTWGGLIQMRTGSAEFNRMLASKALSLGLRYHADGNGIWNHDNSQRMDDGTEPGIFAALGMRYYRPHEREIP